MITAQVFIDWDTARRISRPKWKAEEENEVKLKDRIANVEECFSVIQARVMEKLAEIEPRQQIRIIKSRIYHGWHSGTTMTADRRAWEDATRRGVTNNMISYLPDIEYGNLLSCGGKRMPLYDTLRQRDGVFGQKMVDTALVVDLLSYCRTESKNFQRGRKPESMALVIGDDDDLFPGVFAAEQWGLPVYVFRVSRDDENKHINSAGLIFKL